jgi:CheY-like chemotaxis protein
LVKVRVEFAKLIGSLAQFPGWSRASSRPPGPYLMPPGIDGIEVCEWRRTFSDAYVIMLTARAEETGKLIGLAVVPMTIWSSRSARASCSPTPLMSCARRCASMAKVGVDTMLAQIITMVRQAQASRAPIQRLADAVVAITAFAVWFTAELARPFTPGLVAAIEVLIIPARARRA